MDNPYVQAAVLVYMIAMVAAGFHFMVMRPHNKQSREKRERWERAQDDLLRQLYKMSDSTEPLRSQRSRDHDGVPDAKIKREIPR